MNPEGAPATVFAPAPGSTPCARAAIGAAAAGSRAGSAIAARAGSSHRTPLPPRTAAPPNQLRRVAVRAIIVALAVLAGGLFMVDWDELLLLSSVQRTNDAYLARRSDDAERSGPRLHQPRRRRRHGDRAGRRSPL